MGYTTIFEGEFMLDRLLDDKTYELLKGLASTRRMKRNPEKLEKMGYGKAEDFGVEGEFFIKEDGQFGQTDDESILNHNEPPETQPGLWCKWTPTSDRKRIIWDGGEKFYEAGSWIEYLIVHVLKPRGYRVDGIVNAQGESNDDQWSIIVVNNEVIVQDGFTEGIKKPDLDAYYKKEFEYYQEALKKSNVNLPTD